MEVFSRIRSLLQREPRGLTITEIAERLRVSRNSLGKYLEVLLVSGQVEKRAYGPAKVYTLSQRVPVNALLNMTSTGILVLDDSLRVVKVNDSMLQLIGAERGSVGGSRFAELDSPLCRNSEAVEAALGGEERQELLEDGRFVDARYLPTTFEDGAKGVTIIFEDVTRQRQTELALRSSEERFRNLAESSPFAIQGFTPDGTIFFWNQGSERLYGYTADEALGRDLGELIIPEEVKPLYRKSLEIAAAKEESGEYMPPTDVELLHKDGHRILVHSIHTVVVFEGGEREFFCIDLPGRKGAKHISGGARPRARW